MSYSNPLSEIETCAFEILRDLQKAGYRAYWVGGCVRNRLLGIPAKDVDIATNARPQEIDALFEHVEFVGAKFGVCLVITGDIRTEVATFRSDGPYQNKRHPESVTFSTPEEDALRRDFTINALFYDPTTDEILDFVNGQTDLKAKRIRCVGNPNLRLEEDALRVLRAIRFAARLGFSIEPETYHALVTNAKHLLAISAERIREELLLMLCAPNPSHALDLLMETGIMELILPEVAAMRGVEQPPQYHPEGDVWTHTKMCMELLEKPSPTLAMATLLHDVGKPPTFEITDRIRFNGHDQVGAKMAQVICQRLKFSNADTDAIVTMVKRHMQWINLQQMRPAKSTRFLAAPTIEEELALHRADCLSSHGDLSNYEWATAHLQEVKTERKEIVPKPLLNGHDLIKMGYTPGPNFSKILQQLQDRQIEGATTNVEEAREWIHASFAQHPADQPDTTAEQFKV